MVRRREHTDMGMGRQAGSVATIVLAGGEGKRLYPLTIHHSKPAVFYGGRYRLIDVPISNSINSGFRQIFVIAQYLVGELQHHIGQTYRFDPYDPGQVDVLTPQINGQGEQEWFEGTADAVRKTLPTLLQSPAEYFLILAGDQLYNIDFREMIAFAQSKGADLTIASTPVLEKEARRMGLLRIDRQAQVVDFIEKPQEPEILHKFQLPSQRKEPSYLGSMGIYVFKREALVSLLKKDNRHDFGHHLISTAVQEGKTFAYVYEGYWEDIGTVAAYYEANLLLASQAKRLNTYDEANPIYTFPTFLPGPKIDGARIDRSIVCEGSVINAREISHSVIGVRSWVHSGTVIRDAVLLGNHFYMPANPLSRERYSIGKDCLIEKAIIDERVQIGDGVQLVNRAKHLNYDGEGIFVRDGIAIVVAGTRLPDGFAF